MADHVRRLYRNITRSLPLLSLTLAPLLCSTAHSQRADETARQRIRLKAYGMFSYVRPDYGGDTKNTGGTIGGDIDGFRLLPRTELGLDTRFTYTTGTVSNQRYFGGGPRLSLDLGSFKPYGDFLLGQGTSFLNHSSDPSYTRDVSAVIAYGGGFDYKLTQSWSVRADVQRQRWRFSVTQPYFYPTVVSAGASYQFHFHGRTGPNL